jgi:hypothetical protein
MSEAINLTDRQLLERLYVNTQQQNALLERMVQALERRADDDADCKSLWDTQRIDVETIRREARRVSAVEIGGGV